MDESIGAALPRTRVEASLAAAARTWPAAQRRHIERVRALVEAHQDADRETFFEAAWNADLAPLASRLWFDVHGRSAAVQSLPRLEVGEGEVVFLSGSLRVESNVFVRGMLFVAGDLEVGGELGDDDVGRLIVTEGSVRCRLSNTQGGLHIGDDLLAATLIFGNYHDDSITVGRTLRAPLTLLMMGKRVEAARLETRLIRDALSMKEGRELCEALVPAVLRHPTLDGEDDDELDLEDLVDIEALYRLAADGQPFLRTP